MYNIFKINKTKFGHNYSERKHKTKTQVMRRHHVQDKGSEETHFAVPLIEGSAFRIVTPVYAAKCTQPVMLCYINPSNLMSDYKEYILLYII